MSKGLFTVIFMVVSLNAPAGNDFRVQGAAADALGGCSLTSTDPYAISNNQGAAAFLEGTAIGLSYRSPWIPGSTRNYGLSAAGPVGRGFLGGSISYHGNALYYESRMGIAYGMRLGERFGFGIQLDYLHNKAARLSGRHYCTFEFGLLYRPSDRLRFGVHVFNPVKYRVSERTGELLPVVLRTGVEYRPHDRIGLYTELEKDLVHPFNFKAGISYSFSDAVVVRGGFNTVPVIADIGLGCTVRGKWHLDVAMGYHLDLGFNTSASISLLLHRNEPENPVRHLE